MNQLIRAKAKAFRSTNDLRTIFRNQSGAVDMPSVIIGVIVAGIIAAGIFATVFGVVPFAQDSTAKGNLEAVATAEGTYYAQSTEAGQITTNGMGTNAYAGGADLLTDKLLPTVSDKMSIEGGTAGWIAVSLSSSGKAFVATSAKPDPVEVAGFTKRDTPAETLTEAMTKAKADQTDPTAAVLVGTINVAGPTNP